MGVAETCLAFAHLEAPSAALLLRCAASLRRATNTVTDVLQFAKRYQGGAREPVAMALLARMAEVPAPPEEGRRRRVRGVLVPAAHLLNPGHQPNAIDHHIHRIDQLVHEIQELLSRLHIQFDYVFNLFDIYLFYQKPLNINFIR